MITLLTPTYCETILCSGVTDQSISIITSPTETCLQFKHTVTTKVVTLLKVINKIGNYCNNRIFVLNNPLTVNCLCEFAYINKINRYCASYAQAV